MIVVTVELRSARTGRRRLLGAAVIGNDEKESIESRGVRGTYHASLSGRNGRPWKAVTVRGFPRKRLLAWDLLFRVLREAVGGRNGTTQPRTGLQPSDRQVAEGAPSAPLDSPDTREAVIERAARRAVAVCGLEGSLDDLEAALYSE